MQAKVFVPATIGNVGPGFDVLGLAVAGLGDTLTLSLGDFQDEVSQVKGRDADLVPLTASENAVIIAARHLLSAVGCQYGVKISLDRQLPVAGGLGSSAAASVAGAVGAAAALGKELPQEQLLASALAGESYSAGMHLDNIAPCLVGGLTGVLSPVPPVVLNLPVGCDWWVSLVTPDQKLPTREARSVLPESLSQKDWVDMSARTLSVSHAFACGDADLLRKACQDPYAEPRRAPLVAGFMDVKQRALKKGALACSLSGAGPTIFAICETQKKAEQITALMAETLPGPPKLTHTGPVDKKGARIL